MKNKISDIIGSIGALFLFLGACGGNDVTIYTCGGIALLLLLIAYFLTKNIKKNDKERIR